MKKQREKTRLFTVALVLVVLLSLFLTSCGKTEGADTAAGDNGSGAAEQKVYTVDDFKDAKISSVVGSLESEYISKNFPDAELLEYNNAADALTALRTKKVDFFATQSTMLDIYAKETGDVINVGYKICPTEAGFGIRKGEDELVQAINSVIREYKENGKMEEILSHWADVSNYVVEDIPENTTGETIVVGTSGEFEPINFYIDNKLVGVDVEMIGNILYDLGYQVKYECMAFGALMPALESGKIDIIACDLYITDERKESIDFSDVYYTDYSSFAIYNETASTGFLSGLKDGLYSNLIKEARYMMILDGLKMTAALAIAAGIFGTLLGILLCFMDRSRKRVLKGIKKVYSAIIDGTPMVVILMIVCYVILGKVDASGVVIGMLAFGMVFGNDVCSAIENGLDNIDKGQYEAITALGYPKRRGFKEIILPQLMRNFLPGYRSSFTSMVKATAIAGYVAIQDLTKAGDIIRSRTFDAFIPLIIVAAIYFVIIWLITLLIQYAEKGESRKRKDREVRL